MTQKNLVSYWLVSAEHDQKTALDMFKTGHYAWCLFMWHLVLEKSLKAIISHRGVTPMPVHSLLKLAKQAQIEIAPLSLENLKIVTSFNLEARYDDYKFAFYKKATKKYTEKWQNICESLYKELTSLCQ